MKLFLINFSIFSKYAFLYAQCLIGNSSMGIRECSFLGMPVVNIGNRQQGRERGSNVTEVDYDKNEIIKAVNDWLYKDRPGQSFVYGNGEAGKSIAEVLATVPLRYSKILKFQDEKPLLNPSPGRVERSAWQKHKTT